MKTIRIKEIGNHLVFDRIDELPIDNEMTKAANAEAIEKLPEQQAVNEKVQAKKAHYRKKLEAVGKCRHAQNLIDKKADFLASCKTDEDRNKINIAVEQAKKIVPVEQKIEQECKAHIETCDCELKELNKVAQAKRVEIIKNNPVPAHPRKNEIALLPDGFDMAAFHSECMALENAKMLINIETVEQVVVSSPDPEIEDIKAPFMKYVSHAPIADYRGKQYFYQDGAGNWVESEVITDLGVTVKTVVANDYFETVAIEKSDLTPEQTEEIRIQKLTPEQLEAEKQAAIDNAATQAAAMRSKLEIQGVDPAQALADSQAWYQEQLTMINDKYS